MSPTGMTVERNQSFTYCNQFRFAGWFAATIILVSAAFMLDCGGNSTTAPNGNTPAAVTVSLSPQTAQVALLGQTQFTATVTGGSAGVNWSVNGSVGGGINVGVISSSGLYTAPTILPSPNTVTVTAVSVDNSAQSASASVTIVNPQPAISSISPATIPLGSANTKVTVSGTGFASGSVVELGGTALPTVFWNPTALTATIPAAMLAMPGTVPVLVTTPGPGGGTSSAVNFTIQAGVFATANPQVALYAYAAPQAASVSVEYGTDTTYGTHTWAQNIPAGGGAVQILVAGMMANATYHMRADVTYADGTQGVDQDHMFTTGSPPASRIPTFTATNPNGLAPSPGAILYHLTQGANQQLQAVATDNGGNVIWYYDYPEGLGLPQPIKLLPNGHMLMNLGPPTLAGGTVREIDLAGNIITNFTFADLNGWLSAAGYNLVVNGIHHDLLQLPNGHLLLLVNHYQNFTDLTGYPGTTAVLGDALIELDQNHNIVWLWDSFDHLCPANPTSPCLDINRHPLNLPDWMHSNSLQYSPDDGNIIMSVRNQSWVLKIDYENGQGTGNILWRLGYQGDFTLTNGQIPDWFSAQHYANVVSPNTTGVFNLEMFDDGDNRVLDAAGDVCNGPGQPNCWSRVPIYQLDDSNMTATIVWDDNLSPVYAFWGGSAQQLPDSNLVFCITTPSDDSSGARYMEVTDDSTPQVVLKIEVTGQNAYRAVHLPSLYPGVQW
ncbi:MAG: aryl-sulfate sulfotransferase [Terriglobia bacterium]|jgi:arylsulfate sulfotransferase